MKNFSEATDTKWNLTATLTIKLEPVGENIPCRVTINQEETLLAKTINEPTIITETIRLEQLVDIRIKIEREHPQAIVVSMDIDGHEILPLHQHLAEPPTNYIDFEHGWRITINNFYQWLHEQEGHGWIA